MNPPSVYEVTRPRSQRTTKTTKIVQSILFQSHKQLSNALVSHPEIVLTISQGIHRSQLAPLRLYSCAHFQLFSEEAEVERGLRRSNSVTVARRRIEVPMGRQLPAWRFNFVFPSRSFLWSHVNFTSADDQAFWCGTYIINREASE
jgi:hypothetical protein